MLKASVLIVGDDRQLLLAQAASTKVPYGLDSCVSQLTD
jgi:hypothetical protein